jgi:hypothetical protein
MSAAVDAVAALAVATFPLWGLGACGGKPRPEEAARPPAVGDAAAGDAAAGDAAAGGPAPRGATGDLQVRVEWPDVPVAARSSPGRTPCGTPRAPSVAPTTTWGIPDALVIVEGGDRAVPPPPSLAARVTLADCAVTPRVVVGDTLAITSAVDRPAKLVLRKRGTLDHLAPGPLVPVMLPIAGHTVTAALEPGAVYSLETDEPDPELAFIAAVPGGLVTDATGHVLIRDLAVGAHAVTAWLPPRGGQPARLGHGTATVAAGDLAELTVKLAP